MVAFDLDDTLYPERAYVLSGFRAVAEWAEGEHGIPQAEGFGELESMFLAGVHGDTFNRWAQNHGLEVERLVPQMVQVYRSHLPDIRLYEDAMPALRELGSSFRLALITEGYREVQSRKLEALGLYEPFEFVHIGDEEARERWKPSRYPFERTLERMGAGADEAAYIGDNPQKDFRAPNAMGMISVRVRREDGLHTHSEPKEPESAPAFEVPDLQTLVRALRE